MGTGASPANSEELAIIQQGSKAWNEWREKNKERPSFSLSGADLHGRDLTGADLRAVNLSNANLRGAKLGPGTLLWNANLSNADLYQTNFRGADLQDVNFSNADLYQADLRESNLQGADLSAAKGGLLSHQLAGSDLTGAKLPEPLAKLYAELSSAKEISSNAQKLFLALLAGCLYSWLTIAQTTDVELITNRATTPLPIIQAAIPIVGFYVVAPLILLCLYFYFHFYLQKLWEELGSLPAVFTDGRELHKRTDPWLLNDLVRSHFAKLKDGRPFLSYFQAWISVVLAWWLVPMTTFCFWLGLLHRHDYSSAISHALIVTVSVVSALRFYKLATQTLKGDLRAPFSARNAFVNPRNYIQPIPALVVYAILIFISAGIVYGEASFRFRVVPLGPLGNQLTNRPNLSVRTWIPRALKLFGYSPFANLSGADVSSRPVSTAAKEPTSGFDGIKGTSLENCNLRYANASAAFLAKANLFQADLEGVNFALADLRRANLTLANLEGANLSSAFVGRANMSGTNLQYARLWNADLAGSDLTKSTLSHADFSSVDLTGANLWHSDLRGTVFENAKLVGANFTFADLTDSDLENADVTYAYFAFVERGLSKEEILKSHNWKEAFLPPGLLEQLGLPSDHNQKLQQQLCSDSTAVVNAMTPLNCPTIMNGSVKSPAPKTP